MTKTWRAIIAAALLCLMGSFVAWVYPGKSWIIGFVKTQILHKQVEWAIGIYAGDSPFNLVLAANVGNPILAARDVTDVRAVLVADRFMVEKDCCW